jgi:hypothetical protein
MNKELRLELETQSNPLETMMPEMETLKGGSYHWRRRTFTQDGLFPMWHARTT